MYRIGHGYDIHRFAAGRKLVLGGVIIEHELGLEGHSDADVVSHAVMDALLGGAALGDIGQHFPDTDQKFRDADSIGLLEDVVSVMNQHGYSIVNVDVTIIAEKPKLASHYGTMKDNLSSAMRITSDSVSIKATTNEGIGLIGKGEGIAAFAVALLRK